MFRMMHMRLTARLFASFAVCITTIMVGPELSCGQLAPGDAAPVFSLQDLGGKFYDLSTMKEQSMIVLYFLDVESRPSLEGLLSLDRLAKQYEDADMIMWGITLSHEGKVSTFIDRTNPGFPILLDKTGVSDLYQARVVLPTICIIGPNLKLLDYFQGGGKTTEIMMVKLAERQLQRKQAMKARAISRQGEKKGPKNVKVKMVEEKDAMNARAEQVEKKGLRNVKGKMFKGYDVFKKGIWKVSSKIKKYTIDPISNIKKDDTNKLNNEKSN